jgi:hypothetical protein
VNYIASIAVRHVDATYICQRLRNVEYFRCGKCLRGRIDPTIGAQCKVCGAIVCSVWYDQAAAIRDERERMRQAWELSAWREL